VITAITSTLSIVKGTNIMTQTLENSLNLVKEEQHFYRRGVTWERFQAIAHLPIFFRK